MLELYLRITNWLRNEEGQDLAEYGLLVALIAVVCMGAVTLGGAAISDLWSRIADRVVALMP